MATPRTLVAGLAAAGLCMGAAAAADAATQGLYLFDTIANPTPALSPYEELADASGNGLDIVRQDNFGAVSLDTDRPGVMPAGTFSLNSVAGGVGSLVTPNTDLFSVAKSGELSVEFWFKAQVDGALQYIAEFGNEGANSWDIYQTATGGAITIHAGFRDKFGSFAGMNSGATTLTTTSGWHHIALTLASDGTGRLYIDGSQVGSQSYNLANFETTSSFFRLGAGFNATYGNTFLMDELRISDVALLPGAGTGVDELAWNASLVQIPEPASLTLLGVGGLMIARRRR